jgi:uncharacterized repeat protein (TIGR01451 family)
MHKLSRTLIKVVFLVVLLISSFSVFAATGEELITDSWFYEGDKIHLSGYDFTIDISGNKVYINYDNGYYLLDSGDCESKEITKICYNDKTYDSSKEEDKVQLKFYTVFPVISITRTIEDNSLSIGDYSTISIELENTGLRTAENIVYEEILPEILEIKQFSDDFEIIDNRIRWTGILDVGESKLLNYDIKGKKIGTTSYKATTTYNDGFTEKESSSSSLSVTVSSPQTITITTNSTSISVGDMIDLDINIKNSQSSKITVSNLEIYLPDNFYVDYVDDDSTQSEENKFIWNGDLDYNESKNFDFKIRARYDGKQDILVKGNLIKDNIAADFEEDKSITVQEKELIIKTLITKETNIDSSTTSGITISSTDDKEMESFQEGRFLVYVQNPYPSMTLKNMVISVNSPVAKISGISIDELKPNENKKVIDRTIVAPEVKSSEKLKIITKAEFSSEYNQEYSEILEEDLVINPIKDITIKQDLSSSNPEEGDEVKVTVSIKNNREINLYNIYVIDTIPRELKVKGLTSKTLDLNSGEEVDVYEYTVKLPFTGNETTLYLLNTTVIYEDNIRKYTIDESSKLNAKINTPDIDFKKDISETSALIGENVDTEYTVENEDTQIIKNIKIKFPYIQRAAYLDYYEYNISQIDAGDIVTISNTERIIFFDNKTSINIPETTIYYEDSFGNKYSKKSKKESIDIEHASFVQPFLVVDRIVNKTSTDEESVKTKIIIENIGEKGTEFTIFENYKILYQSYISPGEKKEIDSYINREEYGVQIIPSAVVNFEITPRKYFALSPERSVTFNQVVLEVSEDEKENAEQDEDSENNVENLVQENANQETTGEVENINETEIVEKVEETKPKRFNLIETILSFIKSIFNRK